MLFIIIFILTIVLLTIYKIKKEPKIKIWKLNIILSCISSAIFTIIINIIFLLDTYLIEKNIKYDLEMTLEILKRAGLLFILFIILYFIFILIIDLILNIFRKRNK